MFYRGGGGGFYSEVTEGVARFRAVVRENLLCYSELIVM